MRDVENDKFYERIRRFRSAFNLQDSFQGKTNWQAWHGATSIKKESEFFRLVGQFSADQNHMAGKF